MEDLPWDEVTVEEIHKDLAKLVTEGIYDHYNVGEKGGCLLRLGVVQDRLKDLDGNANEDQRFRAYAKALRSVLTEVIEHDDVSGKSRRLLYDVLPLNEAFRSMKIKERRVEASKHVKPGKKVKPGTVRTYHEPRALEKFAKVILQMESNFRAAYRDGKLVDSDEQDS